jgi:hypothetical protein
VDDFENIKKFEKNEKIKKIIDGDSSRGVNFFIYPFKYKCEALSCYVCFNI